MASETNDNQVSAAFDYILNELPKSCFSLVKEMSVAADLGDYDAVTELTERLKRADILKNELGGCKRNGNRCSTRNPFRPNC